MVMMLYVAPFSYMQNESYPMPFLCLPRPYYPSSFHAYETSYNYNLIWVFSERTTVIYSYFRVCLLLVLVSALVWDFIEWHWVNGESAILSGYIWLLLSFLEVFFSSPFIASKANQHHTCTSIAVDFLFKANTIIKICSWYTLYFTLFSAAHRHSAQ